MGAEEAVFQSEDLIVLILSLILCSDTPCDEHTIAKYVMVCRLFREVIAKLPVSLVVDCYTREMVKGIAKCTPGVTHLVIREEQKGPKYFSEITDDILRLLVDYLPELTRIKFPFGCNNILLKSWKLIQSNVTSVGVSYLAELPGLTHVNLSECVHVDANAITQLVKSCPMLESLDVSASVVYFELDENMEEVERDDYGEVPPDEFRNDMLGVISKYCKNLRELRLDNRMGITSLKKLARCTSLEKLSLYCCKYLRISHIGSFVNLTTLNLSCSIYSIVSDNSIKYLSGLTSLESINISGCKITDIGIKWLARTFNSQLTTLDISDCKNISERGYIHIAMCCNRLTTLVLYRYDHTYNKGEGLDFLMYACKQLSRVVVDQSDITYVSIECINRHPELKFLGIYSYGRRDLESFYQSYFPEIKVNVS
jgi:hypothetical protein